MYIMYTDMYIYQITKKLTMQRIHEEILKTFLYAHVHVTK